MPLATSQSMALLFASSMVSPSRNPELILTPSPVYACVSGHSGGLFTVAMMSRPCCLAKSQSRWSSPGTAMMAPVP
jgi:hypothetical protein